MRLFIFLILSTFLISQTYSMRQIRMWPYYYRYHLIYDARIPHPHHHVFFWHNDGIKLDSETGREYIQLSRPTWFWFGNEKLDNIEYFDSPNWNYTSRHLTDEIYIMRASKKDFWTKKLFIDFSCNHEENYDIWDCTEETMKAMVNHTLGQKIAVWVNYHGTKIYEDAEIPFHSDSKKWKKVDMKDFVFSRENPPKPYMKHYNKNMRSDRKLLKNGDTLVQIPRIIGAVDTYTCVWEKYTGPTNIPNYQVYSTIFQNIYSSASVFSGDDARWDYAYYGVDLSESPLNTNFLHGKKWDRSFVFDTELHQKMISSLLEDVNFCEEDLKKDQVVRILNIFLIKNSLLKLSQ